MVALAVTGMESAEKGPGVTMCKLVMLRDELTGRLEALGPGEVVRGPRPGVQAAFAAKYKDGQKGLLRGLEEPRRLPGEGWRRTRVGLMGAGQPVQRY